VYGSSGSNSLLAAMALLGLMLVELITHLV
jgi:hypothetical protein